MDTSPYGPQCAADNRFRARMRFHQSWWRHERLQQPCGTQSAGKAYGNYLGKDASERGLNSLTPAIAQYVVDRIKSGGGVASTRCKSNLLSSQPMAFNLFGPLHLDADLARTLLDPLLPGGVSSAKVDVEWAPDPATHLNDATSFDVVIRYATRRGQPAIAAVETKLTEPFSPKKYYTARYRETARKSSVWKNPDSPALAESAWNQIWRNHLLVERIRQQPGADPDLLGYALVVHHPLDTRVAKAIAGYTELLNPPGESFLAIPLDQVVDAWTSLLEGTSNAQWIHDFADRYLNLGLSEDAWLKWGARRTVM